MKNTIIYLSLFCFSIAVFASDKLARHSAEYQQAVAILYPTKGNKVAGEFRFKQTPNGVQVNALVSGLTPNQKHGVHIHQFGDLTDMVAGRSAGGHYNPEGHLHGLPPKLNRHAGSYGNLQANEYGEATLEILDTTITIAGIKNPVIGRAVVIHAKEDTGEQPAGNAGARIGLGVIGLARQ